MLSPYEVQLTIYLHGLEAQKAMQDAQSKVDNMS
jgi:hypothetical protein